MKALLSMNAFDRTITYLGTSKTINDDYWEQEIDPILTPVWSTPKDRLEYFVYREDKSFSVQRNKYTKNFKTKEGKWLSYEFDPQAIPEYSVEDLYEKVKEKFIQYKDIGEAEYEKALQTKFRASATVNWDKVKLVRNFLLSESDWTQAGDAPLTEEEKELYRKYRTYLRKLFEVNQVELPYDVRFPITPKEYLSRKETDVAALVTEVYGDQGNDTEYLFSEYHFWTLTSNAVNTFARKMALYMTLKSILDEDSTVRGVKPVKKFYKEPHTNWDNVARKKPGVDPEQYVESLIERIQNGEI